MIHDRFDPEFYMSLYPDLVSNGITTPKLAKLHWLTHGRNEGRIGNKPEIVSPVISQSVKNIINHNVCIVGIARDIEKTLKKGFENIVRIGELFKSYRGYIYENNSEDGTPELLKKLATKYKNIEYESTYIQSTNSPRYQRMAGARNCYVDYILKLPARFDMVIVIDPDITIDIQLSGIIDTFTNKSQPWHAVFANGIYNNLMMTWDAFALRTENFNIPYEPENINYFRKLHTELGTGRVVRSWLSVVSAFGGLGIYKRECFDHCKYDININDCEHVSLHQCMINHGYNKLFINPNMIKKYSISETHAHGYDNRTTNRWLPEIDI